MRLGVLDVGSNTVHLLVVDAHHGAAPLPAHSHKTELRLAEHIVDGERISDVGVDTLVGFVRSAQEVASIAQGVGVPATAALSVPDALQELARRDWPQPPRILICGSLYLAGEVLNENGTPPV